MPADVDLDDVLTPMTVYNDLQNTPVRGDGGTVAQVLEGLHDLDMALITEDWELAAGVVDDPAPRLYRSIPLSLRTSFGGMVPWQPCRSVINRWRTDLGIARASNKASRARPRSWEDIALSLPVKRARTGPPQDEGVGHRIRGRGERDPLKLLRALFFAKFLKSQKEFSNAMGAAAAYEFSDVEPEDRDQTEDPRDASLRLAWARMDIVDMLLWRREFEADCELDGICAINLYTDSSPVSGNELQGLIMDVEKRNGTCVRITLPGTSLAYGLYDGVNKSIGLLHAIWLVAGPTARVIRYVCSKVASITTDMGIEIQTLMMPDLVQAYCRFMDGRDLASCAALINRETRLYPNAIRVGGWSHAHGNIMKHAAEQQHDWPVLLRKMRSLVSFWGVRTYREHVKKC